jgi:ubiquinone/menaquinone biosynthesis C-methylase UbiE
MSAPFKPKQALSFDDALLPELTGDSSDVIAGHLIKELPPLTASSVVHDNGCGYGAVTVAIMAIDPPPPVGVQIHATDVNPMFLTQLNAKPAVQTPLWPVTVATMDVKTLSFPDNTFDLSITNFVIMALHENDGDVRAAAHTLRTLKPGGTGAITVWNDMPSRQIALINAHYKTRGTDEPMAPFLSMGSYNKNDLAQVMKDAGWKDVHKIRMVADIAIAKK